ncbi:glycosyltransferase family 4 protein [Geomonas nitrogeniifigens]|uniref:Glycosyltransferase family 4 protein n=1 Tax=Geomonas diazotrophica TaxID=2843197 RepID=A0ABX8JC59_9BACT|nr:glycosyltransferase family 4 protein [Geomonas nitrogeniifigens]QWV95960.1 glycosyltransferase family 4 protein [Geomonas nitrogeniifigens]
MSHLVIVSAAYPPEPVVSARMSRDLALHLLERGHRVTVLCPQPSRPASACYSDYRSDGDPLVSDEDGVEVVRLPSFSAPQSALLPRLKESWSYGRHVCRYLTGRPAPDALYVNAWPLLAQALVAGYAHRNGVPLVLQVMDVYPESLVNKLPASLRPLAAPLVALDAWVARNARTVVTISEGMRDTYIDGRQVPAERVAVIPTWQDESIFLKPVSRREACARYGIAPEHFTFLYLGNIGAVAGVDFLLRAFHRAALGSAQLVIVGDGSQKSSCQKLGDSLGAANVYFISDHDADNVPLIQEMAHVCMLPVKRGAAASSIPSKLPAYMFSGKPVLATVDDGSDTARAIREAEGGWVGPPEDPEWLAAQMRAAAAAEPTELARLGLNAKNYALEHFSKGQGVGRLAWLVLSALGESGVQEQPTMLEGEYGSTDSR